MICKAKLLRYFLYVFIKSTWRLVSIIFWNSLLLCAINTFVHQKQWFFGEFLHNKVWFLCRLKIQDDCYQKAKFNLGPNSLLETIFIYFSWTTEPFKKKLHLHKSYINCADSNPRWPPHKGLVQHGTLLENEWKSFLWNEWTVQKGNLFWMFLEWICRNY